jgi:hypothetical protein
MASPSLLSQALFKIKKGFIWFITSVGIRRYDGYEFKVFKLDPNDLTNQTVGNKINQIVKNRDGCYWFLLAPKLFPDRIKHLTLCVY